MIREMTMDEALEVVGGRRANDEDRDDSSSECSDPFNNSGSSLLNWDPLAKTPTTIHSPGPTTPVPTGTPCGIGFSPNPNGGCTGGGAQPRYPTAPVRPFGR